jgi:hypothetical protein
MGTFAETAIANYCLFANQGKQTSIFICSKQAEVAVFHFYF